MKKNILSVLAVILIIGIGSCSSKSYREVMQVPEEKFYKGQYKEAAEMLKPLAAKEDRDQLLYMMEAGYMYHIAHDYKLSNFILLKAAQIAKLKPVSVTQQVAALLTNATATNYRGEDFEKVLIRMYTGINFLMLGDYDAARVEFKNVNIELGSIQVEGKARYKQNAMAKYLSAIAFEITADQDKRADDLNFSRVEYKQIKSLMPEFSMADRDIQRIDARMDSANTFDLPQGELVMIFQSGKTAIKKSRGGLLDNPDMNATINVQLKSISLQQGVTIAAVLIALKNAENPIPKFEKRSNLASYVRMVIDGRIHRTFMLENIEETAVKNMEDDYTMMKVQIAAGVITKVAVSIAAGFASQQIAKKLGAGGFSGIIGQVAGAGTAAALFSSMKPDLRCWHTIPANLQMGRVFLNPGSYNMDLQYMNNSDQVLLSQKFNIKIEKGKKTFFTARSLN